MYRVRWTASARGQLADLWVEATDRQALTDSIDELDRLLSLRPHDLGESRTESTRIVFRETIALLFEISDDDRMVRVLRVKRARRRP